MTNHLVTRLKIPARLVGHGAGTPEVNGLRRLESRCQGWGRGAVKGVFFSNPAFFQDLAQLIPYKLTHVRASPRDCADGLAQAARKI